MSSVPKKADKLNLSLSLSCLMHGGISKIGLLICHDSTYALNLSDTIASAVEMMFHCFWISLK